MYRIPGLDDPTCQVHRSLDILGEKWSLLIVRDALRGKSRFSEFRASLGVPTDILTARLATLVEHGILEKRAYSEPGSRERFSYHPTTAGEGLRLVMAAFVQWADTYNPHPAGPNMVIVDEASREPVTLGYFAEDGTRVDAAVLTTGRGAPAA